MFDIEFLCRFMIYLHAKFHMPSSSGSLAITIKPKVKCTFCTAVMLKLYALKESSQKKKKKKTAAYILKVLYHTKFQDPTLVCYSGLSIISVGF
jgi:hypothetical protein